MYEMVFSTLTHLAGKCFPLICKHQALHPLLEAIITRSRLNMIGYPQQVLHALQPNPTHP